jgi:intraflagellar transport protein 80
VILGNLVNKTVSWQNIEVTLDENNKLIVTDHQTDESAEIDFRERLIDMTIGYNYLIVVTSNQCYIYNLAYIQSPYKFDLKEKVKLILTSPKYFSLIDDNNGIYVNIF